MTTAERFANFQAPLPLKLDSEEESDVQNKGKGKGKAKRKEVDIEVVQYVLSLEPFRDSEAKSADL